MVEILKDEGRWVAHIFKQEESIEFGEIFAANVKPMSYKCLLRISVKRGYQILQMDIVTAFLYKFLDEVIYIEQSHRFKLPPEFVCYLRKVLYTLKQTPQVWYQTIADFFKRLDLKQLELDHVFFLF